MIKKIYEATDSIEAWGDGSPIRDFVYAGDVADAILKLYTNIILKLEYKKYFNNSNSVNLNFGFKFITL